MARSVILPRAWTIDGARAAPGRDVAVWALLAAIGAVLTADLPLPLSVALVFGGIGAAALSPVGATAAVMSAIPFVYHLLPLGGQRFSPLELAIVVGCAGLAVRATIMAASGQGFQVLAILLRPVDLSLAAMAVAIAGLVSFLFVADPHYMSESLRELRTVIIEPIGALALMRWTIRQGGAPLVVAALLGTGLLVAVEGAFQYLTRSGGIVGDEIYRARGPYPHPNNLALYLERVVLIAAGLFLVMRRWRRWMAGPLALLLAGLALTFSRGALMGVLVGVVLLVLVVRPRRGWIYLGLGMLAALALFGVAAGGRFFATGSDGAASTRELIWRSSVRMIADHPWTGVGLDQFLYQYGRRYVEPAGWPERYTSHPHNIVLDVWLRLGVLGLVVFVALAALVAWRVRGLTGTECFRSAAAVGAAAALVGGLAHGLVDNGFFLPDLAVLTWVAIGLVAGGSGAGPTEDGETRAQAVHQAPADEADPP